MIRTRNGRCRQGWLQLFWRRGQVNVAVGVVEWRTEQHALSWGCRCLVVEQIIVIALGRNYGKTELNKARKQKRKLLPDRTDFFGGEEGAGALFRIET